MKAIETQNLTKYYGKARGIIDVSLSVDEGDFFGFIGPNGAGKSTTIRTLLGLISATDGKAEIFGKDIVTDKNEILSNVGFLPSETMFYNGMTVAETIAFSAKLRKKDCSVEAKTLCERFELDISRKVNELSLGNRKKVSIVCALQHNPRLFILDEPTSGLDPLMQREFYEVLKERNEQGATVFLSSHVLSEIGRHCKNAAIIREGKLIACDKVEKLGHSGAKRIVLKGVSSIPDIEGIKDLNFENGNANFLYGGDIKMLLGSISTLNFTDINISDPDLEEVFLHFYTKEEN
jgi:ABC-2 type transport system ATP-binding protein